MSRGATFAHLLGYVCLNNGIAHGSKKPETFTMHGTKFQNGRVS